MDLSIETCRIRKRMPKDDRRCMRQMFGPTSMEEWTGDK